MLKYEICQISLFNVFDIRSSHIKEHVRGDFSVCFVQVLNIIYLYDRPLIHLMVL